MVNYIFRTILSLKEIYSLYFLKNIKEQLNTYNGNSMVDRFAENCSELLENTVHSTSTEYIAPTLLTNIYIYEVRTGSPHLLDCLGQVPAADYLPTSFDLTQPF